MELVGDVRAHLAVNERLSPERRAEVLDILDQRRVLLRDHIALQSGRHSELFLRFRQLGRDEGAARKIAEILSGLAPTDLKQASVILTAESAAFLLGRALEAHTGRSLAVARINERRRPMTALRSGSLEGGRVVVVTDVVTTGESLGTLMDLVDELGGKIDCVLAFATLDQQAFTKLLNDRRVPGAYLVSALWPTFAPEDCPQCKSGLPVMPALELT